MGPDIFGFSKRKDLHPGPSTQRASWSISETPQGGALGAWHTYVYLTQGGPAATARRFSSCQDIVLTNQPMALIWIPD